MKKRQDYISWDEYFMGVALLSAHRSKDPNTQVGACIVNYKNKIVGTRFLRFPFSFRVGKPTFDIFTGKPNPYKILSLPELQLPEALHYLNLHDFDL